MLPKSDDVLSTPPPEDSMDIRKQYEDMSYDEMSRRIAESYKQLSEILGSQVSLPSTADTITIEKEEKEETKRQKYTKLLLQSASKGDLDKVVECLETMNPFIDINAKDKDGTTSLIYAACFGKFEIAQALLTAGAQVDDQDLHGWTALMWATTNNHESLVKLLLDYGASAQTKSAKGRTVFDFVKNDANKIADILTNNPRNSTSSSTSSVLGLTASESLNSLASKDHYYPYEENYECLLNFDNENRPKMIEEYLMNHKEDDVCLEQDAKFNWEKCMPDQMFVFTVDDLSSILDMIITQLTLPVYNSSDIFLPVNVIFLCARFAHYYSSLDLAEDVMNGALERIKKSIKGNTDNVHMLSYWMANMTRLLYCLKKDAGLVITTAHFQLKISELVSETYILIIQDTEKRFHQILEQAMLEYDPIVGMEGIDFADDWQWFFRKKSTSDTKTMVLSPESITSLLSSTLYVLQSYEVHSTIIIQTLAQFFHFLSCEIFNRMLTKKKYLSRSKAIQIRMNIFLLEEWVRDNRLPLNLLSYLKPSVQLVQLLQCVSQLDTLAMDTFDALNSLQIRRCIINYRYETNEPKISDEILSAIGYRPPKATERVSRFKEEEETKDSEFMLPFFVPTMFQLSLVNDKSIPMVPQEWMDRLDKSTL